MEQSEENKKETLDTLNDIINSMEKEITKNQIAFDSIIKQCFDHTGIVCQNPDSVLLEQNNIMNEFNRVSSIIKDEVKTCERISSLVEERKLIETRLQNASLLVALLSDYRAIYEQLVNVEPLLHKEKLQEVVSQLKDNEKRIHTLQGQDGINTHLLSVLQRVNKRKLFYVQTILTDLLKQRITIESDSIAICPTITNSLTPFKDISLTMVFSLMQEHGSFDSIIHPYLTQLKSLCETVLFSEVSLTESIFLRDENNYHTLSLITSPSILTKKGVYPIAFSKLLSFISTHLLSVNDELKELFVDNVYTPIEEVIVDIIKKSIPKNIQEIKEWKNQFNDITKIEESAMKEMILPEDHTVITSLIQSVEWEWIRSRQNSYFEQLRSLLIQKRENVSLIVYDCQSPNEQDYSFDFSRYGEKDKETGYYSLFVTPSPQQQDDSFFRNELCLGVCTIYSNFLSVIHLLHQFIREGVSLELVQVKEQFISVFKELVHLILIRCSGFDKKTGLQENCCMFNCLSVLLYHIFLIPYKYIDAFNGIGKEYYVCIEEIPHIRQLQHDLYINIQTTVEKEIPPLIMEYQSYDNSDKIKPLEALCRIREAIQSLCGEAHDSILCLFQSKVEVLSEMDKPEDERVFLHVSEVLGIE